MHMDTEQALAEVHRHFCAKDGTHDDACVALWRVAATKAGALREAADELGDWRTLPELPDGLAFAVMRWLRDRAAALDPPPAGALGVRPGLSARDELNLHLLGTQGRVLGEKPWAERP